MEKYKVVSNHEIFVDDYTEGEGAHVNSFTLTSMVECENPQEAIGKHLDSVGYNLDFNNCEVSDCGEFVDTSCLVDSDNIQPSQHQVDQWKKGEITLYADRISLHVYELKKVNFR